MVDDRVPGQPKQPAPEGDAPGGEPRQGLQGLDEDKLRQVLRVTRVADAAGDEPVDRHVVGIEDRGEGLQVALLGLGHEAVDRFVVHRG